MGLRSSYLSASGFRPPILALENSRKRQKACHMTISGRGAEWRKPEADPHPLGLRPKSVTPACASTSGARKGDAIIASQKAPSMDRVGFRRNKSRRDAPQIGQADLSGEHVTAHVIKRTIS